MKQGISTFIVLYVAGCAVAGLHSSFTKKDVDPKIVAVWPAYVVKAAFDVAIAEARRSPRLRYYEEDDDAWYEERIPRQPRQSPPARGTYYVQEYR